MINAAHIRVMPDGQHFRLDGKAAATIMLVRDRHGYPADLVAWLESEPEYWWMREGDETPILGASQLVGAEWVGFPLSIYPTPAAWAASGGEGVCVIDWDMNLLHLFDGLDLEVGHLPLGHARRLAQRLRDNFRDHEPKIIEPDGGYE